MPIIAQCGKCARQYTVGEALQGKRFRCKACGEAFSVPADSSAAPAKTSAKAAAVIRSPAVTPTSATSIAPAKICVVCRKNVSALPRTKDAQGRYYCQPCYQKANVSTPVMPPASATAEPAFDDLEDYGPIGLAEPTAHAAELVAAAPAYVPAPAPESVQPPTGVMGMGSDWHQRVLKWAWFLGIAAVSALVSWLVPGIGRLFSLGFALAGLGLIGYGYVHAVGAAFNDGVVRGLRFVLNPYYAVAYLLVRWSATRKTRSFALLGLCCFAMSVLFMGISVQRDPTRGMAHRSPPSGFSPPPSGFSATPPKFGAPPMGGMTPEPSRLPHPPDTILDTPEEVDVEWQGKWYPGKIYRRNGAHEFTHFEGHEDGVWVQSSQVRPRQ